MLDSFQTIQREAPWIFTLVAGIFGATVGSFLNVCIYRIPAGRSVISPPSHCACGTPIPWYRNIPVLSWIFLRGRAPCCGKPFSIRYPLIETLTGILFALCWHWLPWQVAVPGFLFLALLVVLAFIDLDTMMLPDSLNVGLALLGLVCSAAFPLLHQQVSHSGLANSLLALTHSGVGMLLGAGLIYWFRLLASLAMGREAMGEGDVILLGGIGAFCGWQGAVFALFGGAVLGTLVLVPLLIAQRLFRPKNSSKEKNRQASLASCEGDEFAEEWVAEGFGLAVPFGPWLALGGAVWFLGSRTLFAPLLAQLQQMLGN